MSQNFGYCQTNVEDTQQFPRFPKAKLVIVTLIIELEYLLKCRQIMGAETFGVLDMIKTLRREINWTE